jgi:hypothetical protein
VVPFPAKKNSLFISQIVHPGAKAHPASYSVSTRDSCAGRSGLKLPRREDDPLPTSRVDVKNQ